MILDPAECQLVTAGRTTCGSVWVILSQEEICREDLTVRRHILLSIFDFPFGIYHLSSTGLRVRACSMKNGEGQMRNGKSTGNFPSASIGVRSIIPTAQQ
jgi:hypothetical protein